MAGFKSKDKPHGIYEMAPGKVPKLISEPIGLLDGLYQMKNGDILATDWVTGSLFQWNKKMGVKKLATGFKGPADFCVVPNAKGLLVAVPDLVKRDPPGSARPVTARRADRTEPPGSKIPAEFFHSPEPRQPMQPGRNPVPEREQHRGPHEGRGEIRELKAPIRHFENAGDQRYRSAQRAEKPPDEDAGNAPFLHEAFAARDQVGMARHGQMCTTECSSLSPTQ